jgi:hypothetical protein
MIPPNQQPNSGVGPTEGLSLRVSVATLDRVIFKRPADGTLMLALERKATLIGDTDKRSVYVRAQPFGGAVRILSLDALREVVDAFKFDSNRSEAEQDFRLLIQPVAWEAVKQFHTCVRHQFELADHAKIRAGHPNGHLRAHRSPSLPRAGPTPHVVDVPAQLAVEPRKTPFDARFTHERASIFMST